MNKLFSFVLSAVALTVAVSCSTDDIKTYDSMQDQELLIALNVADLAMESDFRAGMDAAADDSSLRMEAGRAMASVAPCAEISVSDASFPKTYTIDFGAGCTHNGITRSGIITITLTDFFFANGTVITLHRDNYRINGYKVDGTVVYTNITSGNDVPQWTRTISNGQITNPMGQVFTHSGSRTVRQIGGANTPYNLPDNVYEVSQGTHTIHGAGGSTLTSTVISPLIKMYTCPNISQGVLHIQGSWLDGNLDYGTNSCDSQAVYTHSDGTTFNVSLY